MRRKQIFAICLLVVGLFLAGNIQAQTTEFSYQGSLQNGANPANGNYDFEFALFNAVSGGTQIGSTVSLTNVSVTNGVFSVQINFNDNFTGANRFLEIRVRQTGGGAFTTLTPRQLITSSPYSIRSLNAETAANAQRLGGIAANQFVQTNDSRLTDSRNPLPNSANYIQNTTVQQTGSNFSISGNGTVGGTFSGNIINAASLRVAVNSGNILLGNAGCNPGFVGIGFAASFSACTNYSILGNGTDTNINRPTGGRLFFRENNVTQMTIAPGGNVGIGTSSPTEKLYVTGNVSVTGNNTIGGTLTVGNNATVGETLTGSIVNAGVQFNINGNQVLTRDRFDLFNTTASFGYQQRVMDNGALRITGTNGNPLITFTSSGNIVIGSFTSPSNSKFDVDGTIGLTSLDTSGMTPLCYNGRLAQCSSSIRYKLNISDFRPGLSLIKQLRPVSFNWNINGMPDVGLVAEEVFEIEPLLTTKNDKGETEGVKYDRVGVVLVNAVQEQQTQIEVQQDRIEKQQTQIELLQEQSKQHQNQIDSLKKLVCLQTPNAEICREEQK